MRYHPLYGRVLVICLVFFFSSRRRHTRYWRDWSSDVCSSDLHLSIQDLKLQDHSGEYTMNNLQLKMGKEQHKNFASLISDFADIHINGVFNYSQLPATIYNIIGSRLPRSEEHTSELQSRQYLVC